MHPQDEAMPVQGEEGAEESGAGPAEKAKAVVEAMQGLMETMPDQVKAKFAPIIASFEEFLSENLGQKPAKGGVTSMEAGGNPNAIPML